MWWQLQLSLVITFLFEVNACDICLCTENTILCDETHQITSVPRLELTKAKKITVIVITGQPQLIRLTSEDLMYFDNLIKLQIARSGLRYIHNDAFMFNHKLKQINLRQNKLNWLSWRIFDHVQLSDSELLLEDNPLTCNCSVLWLQTLPHDITCVDEPFTSLRSIKSLEIAGCELPRLSIEPSNVIVEQGADLNFTCSVENQFVTSVEWNKTFQGLNESVTKMNFSEIMTIHKVEFLGQSVVECYAENEVGRSKVQAVLEVTAQPEIKRLYSHLSFYWSICYFVSGYPNPTLSWKLNDTNLDAYEHNIIDVVDVSTSGSVNGCLQLPRASLDLHGKYTLTAANALSNATKSIFFNPGVAPATKSKPARFRPSPNGKFPLFSLVLGLLGVAILILIVIVGSLAYLRHRRHRKRRLNTLQFSHLIDNPTYSRQSG